MGPRLFPALGALVLALVFAPAGALAQFDEIQNYGDGRTDGGGPGSWVPLAPNGATITAGGGDFWGGSDRGSFVTNSDGSLTTTTDFTATARHVNTIDASTNPWGREPLMMRAQAATGAVLDPANPANTNANSAHYMAMRRSASDVTTGWRHAPGGGTQDWARSGGGGFKPTGPIATTPHFLAIARSGGDLYSAHAGDISFGIGAPTPGRWLELHNTIDGPVHPNIGAGTEVTVGVGHQAHNAIPGGGGAANVTNWDSFAFNNGTFDAGLFGGVTAGDYAVGGGFTVNPDGSVEGSAYTFENGAATGEPVGWKIQARKFTLDPQFGVENAQNNNQAVDIAQDLVPDAAFRQGGDGSPAGLVAEIFLGPNNGANQTLARDGTLGVANGTTTIPNVWWNGPGNGPANGYPDAAGVGGNDNHGGANDTNLFAEAVQPGAGGPFEGNQDSYGVQMSGQIFIPASAVAQGFAAFKDGVDDYTFLEIGGQTLIDDNSWTGVESNQNQGGAVSLYNTSGLNSAGEWVDFRMVMWEGGGGDTCALYWDIDGTSSIQGLPFVQNTSAEYTVTGTSQVGDDVSSAVFPGVQIPGGVWSEVSLMVANTGVGLTASETDVGVPQIDIYDGSQGPGEVYWQNFDGFADGTTDVGDGSQMNGTASVQGGQLRLTTDGVAGGFASFIIPALANSSAGFTASFDLTISDGPGANPPADGMSFNFGNFGLAELGSAEEGMAGAGGVTENVSFEIDSWMNFDGEQGVNIAEKVGGADNNLAFTNGPILNDGTSVGGPVSLSWDPANGASFSTAGLLTNAAFGNVATTFAADDAHLFGFSGRVGGANETKLIDNLLIEAAGDPLIESGVTLIDFGPTSPGVPVVRPFTVVNTSTVCELVITGLSLPSGYSLVGGPLTEPLVIPPDSLLVAALQLNGDPGPLVQGGTVVVENTSSDSPYTFEVTGVVDSLPPVISGLPKDIVITVAEEFLPLPVTWDDPTATDNYSPPNPEVTCDPASGSDFGLGTTTVTCTAVDDIGNVAEETFTVTLLPEIPAGELLEPAPHAVLLPGEPAPGSGGGGDGGAGSGSGSGNGGIGGGLPPGATIRSVRRAYLNESSEIGVIAALADSAAGVDAAFSNSFGFGSMEFVTATGIDDTTSLDRLRLNDAGDVNLRDDTAAEFRISTFLAGGGVPDLPLLRAEVQNVYQQAQADGLAVVPLALKRVDGVTTADDTLLFLPPGSFLREGDPAPGIPGATIGQMNPRAVARGGNAAFASGLRGVSGATAGAVFLGPDDGSAFVPVLRKGDPIAGAGAGTVSSFAAESINDSGDLALRCSVRGPGIFGGNNDLLISNRGDGWEIIAREGEVAPCIDPPGPTFGRFSKLFMNDDGSVLFFAFLSGPGVGSGNDGSLWNSDADGVLHLVAREGEVANNTDGIYSQLLEISAATGGAAVFTGRLVNGIGDALSSNNTGLWRQSDSAAPPELRLRQGDRFFCEDEIIIDKGAKKPARRGADKGVEEPPKEEEEDQGCVIVEISLDPTCNAQGGTGGYGRVMTNGGDIAVRLSVDGGTGAYLLKGEAEPR